MLANVWEKTIDVRLTHGRQKTLEYVPYNLSIVIAKSNKYLHDSIVFENLNTI